MGTCGRFLAVRWLAGDLADIGFRGRKLSSTLKTEAM